MKKAILFLTFTFLIALIGLWAAAPYLAKTYGQSALENAGYEAVQIGEVSLTSSSLKVQNIAARGHNGKLTGKDITINFALGLGLPKITNITAERIVFPYTLDIYSKSAQTNETFDISALPEMDIETLVLKLNFKGKAYTVDITDLKNKNGDINATTAFESDHVTFNASLDATVKTSEDYTATLTFNSLEGQWPSPVPLMIKRGFGWISAKKDSASNTPHLSSEMTFGVLGIAGASLNSVTTNLSTDEDNLYTLSIEGSGLNKTADLSVFAKGRLEDALKLEGNIDFNANDLSTVKTAFPDENLPNITGALAVQANFDLDGIVPEDLTNIDTWQGGLGLSANLKDISYAKTISQVNANIKSAIDFQENTVSLNAPKLESNLASLYELSGTGKITDASKLKMDISAHGQDQLYSLNADATLNLKEFSYQLNYKLTPKDGLSLKGVNTLLKPYGHKLADYKGSFRLNGTLTPNVSKHVLAIKDISAIREGINLQGANGVLTLLNGNMSNQEMYIAGLDLAGLPLKNGYLTFDYKGKGNTLRIKDMKWDLTGGHITSTPFDLDMDTMTTEFTLQAENLGLSELFQLAPLDGLNGEGHVAGSIPVRITNGKVEVNNAGLAAVSDGIIKYNPAQTPAFLQTENPQMAALREALKNYNFETLEMNISGESGKEQQIVLKAMGSNPEFYDGRDVKLNLNLEGELDNLLKFNLGTYKIPDKIKQQLNAFED